MAKLNKRDLIQIVSDQAYLSLKDSKRAVDVVFSQIEKSLINGDNVNISNFGMFEMKGRKERTGTDPKSHQKITIKSKNTIVFHAADAIKDKIN